LRSRIDEKQRELLAAILAVVALAAVFGILLGSVGGGSASAAYYYYNPGSGPVVLTLAPASSSNTVGTSHTVTATVTQDSSPIQSVIVRFSVSGAVSTSGSCTSDANGECGFSYAGPTFPGSDVISAFADTNGNGKLDSDESTASATKTWVAPASTPGKASGDGQITIVTDVVSFGFSAKSSGTAFSGSCAVIDHATKAKISCGDVTAFSETGNKATFYGHANHNGAATQYVISVADNGSPGDGADTFAITTADGYSASGTLTSGNIQVR
jgi:hypothetical protein